MTSAIGSTEFSVGTVVAIAVAVFGAAVLAIGEALQTFPVVQCGLGLFLALAVLPEFGGIAAGLLTRPKSVELFGCLYCRDSEGESIHRHLDMGRFA
jgi:hypothetical protein